MLYLPVDANASGLQARVLSLYAWLQAAPLRYPHAFWICKADDDVYIVLSDWLSQLRLIESSRRAAALLARRDPAEEAIVHGKILFHNMDAAAFTPKSFSHVASTLTPTVIVTESFAHTGLMHTSKRGCADTSSVTLGLQWFATAEPAERAAHSAR